MTENHVHDCTGPDQRCACGFVFRVPPICFSVEVLHKSTVLIAEHFNCETIDVAIEALEDAARELRRKRFD